MKNKEAVEIYVHIPFCARKCDYCDFVSFVCGEDTQKKYFDALIKHIDIKRETVGKVPVVSCFFGGGTPSLPKAEYIEKVLNKLFECFDFREDAEITIEMNPNSGTLEKLKAYRAMGFNRVSIGLQSTEDKELTALSRLHNYEEFLETFKAAREAGFENINVDLMSALPGQTLESYKKTLERVTALEPEHISAYSLIVEENTPFYERYKDGKNLPSEDTEREMYYLTKSFLGEKGYSRYEISNYSKKGYECRHNIGYWRRIPYLGFGIAAASLYGETRYQMHSDLKRFIEGDFSEEKTLLTEDDRMEEFMFLGLRCRDGVSKKEFYGNFCVNLSDVYGKEIDKLSKQGLLVDSDRVFLTDKGLDVANYCMSEFIRL